MEFQIALNTVFLLMMVVFPGFLFRKFYFVGEFTKQFRQDTQFDKLIWNIFFSSISILITVLSIYVFKRITNLSLLDSISYDSIAKLIKPIQESTIPDKDLLYKMYKDLLILVSLIYFFASFLGLTCFWVVRVFGLDIIFPLLRFNNHWYYYIHGGRILYNNKPNRKREFTNADVLCEQAGETQLYTGILSQYVINKETNHLESVFLTNASRYKISKNSDGSTKQVALKEIPGDTFCIPYSRVLNMNLVYVYRPINKSRKKNAWLNLIRFFFLITIMALAVSIFFDLSDYGIRGFFDKTGYLIWTMLAISNIKLIFQHILNSLIPTDKDQKSLNAPELPGQISLLLVSVIWISYIVEGYSLIWYILATILVLLIASIVSEVIKKNQEKSNKTNRSNEVKEQDDIEII